MKLSDRTGPSSALQDLNNLLHQSAHSSVLRFSTAGSVDDGKSTLIGRLLFDSKNVYEDHIQAIRQTSNQRNQSFQEALAYLTDGLKAEREQGITIDVAYRYFSTPRRHFILADSPGHEQYTRNMATGASTANLSILLVDAQKGVVTQTKRHAFITVLLGVPRLLIAINKMDLIGYSEQRYLEIKEEFEEFATKLGARELRFIPVSALAGDNIVEHSNQMPWYSGETVLEYLENIYVASDVNLVDLRFPIQYVMREQNFRGYAGQIASGVMRPGDDVTVLPSLRQTKIKSIELSSGNDKSQLTLAFAPMSVTVTLQDEIDIVRGDLLARTNNIPQIKNQFEAMVVWMGDQPMQPDESLLIRHTTRESKVYIDQLRYKIDVNTLHRLPGDKLSLNEIGRLSLTSAKPLFLDTYQRNRSTGNFILIDPKTFLTVGAGMIIDRLPEEFLGGERSSSTAFDELPVSQNIHKEESAISRQEREKFFGHPACTFWFTGLSGSGKSSIAKQLERDLFRSGRPVYRLDGDNIRWGLNRDLGFSSQDRNENIRRIAEVAKLFNQAGISVICSFISPFKADRNSAREIIGTESFIEIYLNTPLEVCEQRDPHGLYRKARAGELHEFTGISSPYQPPEAPEITIDTQGNDIEDCVKIIRSTLKKRGS